MVVKTAVNMALRECVLVCELYHLCLVFLISTLNIHLILLSGDNKIVLLGKV